MSGDAIFSGGNYQAGVIAYAFVHVLAEAKLNWLTGDDTLQRYLERRKAPVTTPASSSAI